MKNRSVFFVALLFILGTTSCLVKSLHPFYYERDVKYIPELAGTWIDQDSSRWMISRGKSQAFLSNKSQDQNWYYAEYADADERIPVARFVVNYFELKGVGYLDFEPMIEENIGDNLASWHFIPSHSVARIERYGSENAAFIWYDEDWLRELFEQNRIKISHESIQMNGATDREAYILTASTGELQKFLIKYGEEVNIFKNIDRQKVMEGIESEEIFRILEEEIQEQNKKKGNQNDPIYINMKKE